MSTVYSSGWLRYDQKEKTRHRQVIKSVPESYSHKRAQKKNNIFI
jgi:hypothetical protein